MLCCFHRMYLKKSFSRHFNNFIVTLFTASKVFFFISTTKSHPLSYLVFYSIFIVYITRMNEFNLFDASLQKLRKNTPFFFFVFISRLDKCIIHRPSEFGEVCLIFEESWRRYKYKKKTGCLDWVGLVWFMDERMFS